MTMARALLAVLATLALAAPGGTRASSALKPLLLKRGHYGESFTFIADLEDGTYVQLTLMFTNLGPGGTKGLCRGLVVKPGGETWKASARYGSDEYRWRGGEEERLEIGPCSAWIDGAATGVEVKLEGGGVRLVLPQRPGPRAGRDTVLHVDKGRYETEVMLQRVPVTASLALPGEQERRAAGGGYVDHTRSTVSPIDLAQRWIRFRALRGDRGLLLLCREGHDGRFDPMWACAGAACRDYRRFKVDRSGGGAPSFHVALEGAADPIDIRSGRLIYRDAPIEELGMIGKVIRPFTGNPVTYVMRGRASEDGGPPVDGILEVELASE
jgi:hypothetical protein